MKFNKIIETSHTLYKSDFFKKTFETFSTKIFLILLGLFSSALISRILGPEGRGLLAAATTVGLIGVQFGNFGLHASNTYFVAKDRKLLSVLVSNTLVVCFLLSSLVIYFIWLIFQHWPFLAPVKGTLLNLSLIYVPLGLAYLLFQNLLIGIQEIHTFNKIERLTSLFGIPLVLVLVLINQANPENIYTIGLGTTVIALYWSFTKVYDFIDGLSPPSLSIFKNTLFYGFKAYLAAFFAFMVIRCDTLMIQYMLGAEQLGFYSVSVALADKINVLPVAVGTILFPKLSEIQTIKEKVLLLKKTIPNITLLLILSAIIAGLLAKPFIVIFYGDDFSPAVLPFIILLPGLLFLGINTLFMNFFASIGMPMITVYSPAIASLVNILANILLIPWLGIIGASVSSVLSYGLMLFFSILYLLKSYKVHQ